MQTSTPSPMKLTVLTPTKRLLDGVPCKTVYFPSAQGVLGILPEHTDLVCSLGTGIVFYDIENSTSFLTISGGIGQVTGDSVTLLADVAEEAASIDVGRAQRALERARQHLLGKGDARSAEDVDGAAAAEARALARIEAGTLHAAGR